MLIGILAATAVILGGLWLFQRQLIYLPARGVPSVADTLPGWEDIAVETNDGVSLGAWYRGPDPGAPVVIVFNGNAGNREGRLALGSRLADAGLGVLLFDYRGYGDSGGAPTETGLTLDARAVAKFVARRAADHPVVYYGESLGAAVAIALASEQQPDALIVRSPFTSLADAARVHYPFLPVRLLLWDEYPSIDRIGSLHVPVLVVAGSDDSIVPTEQSRRIHAAAAEPKELVIIAGADHNDFELLAGGELIESVVGFVAEHTQR
jgi:fermentation-respiration switch protein FrsA (DUF1100 family)